MSKIFKFKVVCAFMAFTFLLLSLVGCQNDGLPKDTSSPETILDTENNEENVKMKILFGESSGNYRIVKSDDSEINDIVTEFLTSVKKKTGIRNLTLSAADTEESEKELLIGDIKSRTASVEGMGTVAYTAGSVKFIGEKLVVSAYSSEMLEKALDKLLAALTQDENGEWGVLENIDINVNTGVTIIPPTFKTTNATYTGFYTGNGTQYQVAYTMPYTRATLAEFDAYKTLLKSSGYTEYSTNTIGVNRFATYVNEKTEIHLIWYPTISEFRIVYGSRGYLPATEMPDYQKLMDATVTQNARRAVTNSAAGECYIIQLEDGSFVIIDGGPESTADMADLLLYLKAKKPSTHQKPRVTWMFTHLHNDHMGLALQFLKEYSNEIELQTVCYNFPNLDNALNDANSSKNCSSLKALLWSYYRDTNVFVFHSGQKMYLPGCEIEFLFTQEDYWPNEFPTANHTSAAWRMTFTGGKTFFVLGDCEKGLCAQMAKVYADYLESDVLQVSHHGLNGATLELYQYVDPKICLWPIDQYRFETDGRCLGLKASTNDNGYSYTVFADPNNKVKWESYNFNYWLRNTDWTRSGGSVGERTHYHASQTTTINMKDLSVTVS